MQSIAKAYLHELDSIRNELASASEMSKHLAELDNYLEQIKCVKTSSLFKIKDDEETSCFFNTSNLSIDASNLTKVNKLETKQKLLFKVTRLVNESVQQIQLTLLV